MNISNKSKEYTYVTKFKENFPFLSAESVSQILKICTYKEVKNRELIIKAGDKSRIFFFILEGTFRGYFINKQGNEVNMFLRQEPSIFGTSDTLSTEKATKFNIESILPSKILFFNIEEFEVIAFQNPEILKLFVSELKSHLQNLVNRIEGLVDKQPEDRYLELLKTNPKLFQSAFNKHIANFLGITPVSLSRIIKRIKDKKNNVI